MKRIVLIRHGESQWNLENRFTGWTNVDLTEKGKKEAFDAGTLMKKEGYHFDIAYTSYLKRAVKTLNNVLDAMDEDWIPVVKTWRLNEKHYGALQGLNKKETAQKYGDEQVLQWRRSYDVAPHDLAADGTGSALADPRTDDLLCCGALERLSADFRSAERRSPGISGFGVLCRFPVHGHVGFHCSDSV